MFRCLVNPASQKAMLPDTVQPLDYTEALPAAVQTASLGKPCEKKKSTRQLNLSTFSGSPLTHVTTDLGKKSSLPHLLSLITFSATLCQSPLHHFLVNLALSG